MPANDRVFQVGNYWLSQRSNSANWCATWFEPSKRQTVRKSLGARDLESAKVALSRFALENAEGCRARNTNLTIAEAAVRYYKHRAEHLGKRSAGVARRNLHIVVEAVGELPISEFLIVKQNNFVRELSKKYKPGTIRRIFETAFAAFNFVHANGEIVSVPKKIQLPDSPPKDYIATIEQLRTFWSARKPDYMQTLYLLLLTTAARPSTLLDLSKADASLATNLIDLNPAGRQQNKKRRPVIPMCSHLRELIEDAPDGPLIHRDGERMVWLYKGWRELRRELSLPEEFTPGCIRHTVATQLRNRNVPPAQISGLLGHSMPNWRTTERYAKYDPNYLSETTEALDAFLDQVAGKRPSPSFITNETRHDSVPNH